MDYARDQDHLINLVEDTWVNIIDAVNALYYIDNSSMIETEASQTITFE